MRGTRSDARKAIASLLEARPEARAELARRVAVQAAREDLGEFGAYVDGFRLPAFHRLWTSLLMATGLGQTPASARDSSVGEESGPVDRLPILAPPGHAKTTWVAVLWPVWLLGQRPELQILVASATSEVVALSSAQARALIRGNPRVREVFPRLRPDPRRADRETEWFVRRPSRVSKDPSYVAVGFDGSVTGRRADLLIMDDPVKNQDQVATSEARDRTWQIYQQVLLTRLNPGAKQVIIATRWHEDDLPGRLLAQMQAGGEEWRVLSLPALAEEGDPLGRQLEEPLWPERFPAAALAEKRSAVGSQVWAALYQQRPAPPEGALFKSHWWRYWRELPEKLDMCLLSVDCAFKDTDSSDYVVIQVWANRDANIYLLDQWRDRATFSGTLDAIQEMARRWPDATLKLIEDAANGPAVINALHQRVRGIVSVRPLGGKLSRAQAILPLVEAGNVHLPDPAVRPWVADFLTEAQSFPVGAHDDQIDAMSQGLQRFLGVRGPAPKAVDDRPQYVKDIEKQAKRIMQGYSGRGPMVRPSEWRR